LAAAYHLPATLRLRFPCKTLAFRYFTSTPTAGTFQAATHCSMAPILWVTPPAPYLLLPPRRATGAAAPATAAHAHCRFTFACLWDILQNNAFRAPAPRAAPALPPPATLTACLTSPLPGRMGVLLQRTAVAFRLHHGKLPLPQHVARFRVRFGLSATYAPAFHATYTHTLLSRS